MNVTNKKIYVLFFQILPLELLLINYILYSAFDITEYKTILRVVALGILMFGALFVFKRRVSKLQIIWLLLAILQVIVNGSMAFNLLFLVLLAIVLCGDIDDIIKIIYIVVKFTCAFMLVLLFAGILENRAYIIGNRERYTLGFLNPNSASFFYTTFVYFYILSKKNLSIKNILFGIGLVIGIFYFTNSRTYFFAAMFFLLFAFFSKFGKIKIFNMISWIISDGLLAFGLFSVAFIDKLFYLDKLLSNRIYYFSQYLSNANWQQYIIGGMSLEIDNFYYMFLLGYGIVIYIFFAFFIHRAMKKLFNEEKTIVMVFLASVLLAALMEGTLIRPEIMISVFVWKIIMDDGLLPKNAEVVGETKIDALDRHGGERKKHDK